VQLFVRFLTSFPHLAAPALSVLMLQLVVPELVLVGEDAALECFYDLEGEDLYSVKWYKGGKEFFRYIPGDRERITTFSHRGVLVDVSRRIWENKYDIFV
jgi:hypothetical protein